MLSRVARTAAAVVLAVHLAAGIAALILLPHGFAPDDLHLWSNTVIPALASVVTATALVRFFFFRSRASTVSVLVAAASGGWTSAVITGAVLFPTSMSPARCAAPASVALALLVFAWWAAERRALSIVALVVGGGLGAVVILAQRAPLASTRPVGGALSEVRGEPSSEDAAVGQVAFTCGKNKMRIKPLLSFQSRSPDRTWPLLAGGDAGNRRKLSHYVKTPTGFRAAYIDDGESTIVAVRDKNGLALDIEATSKLPEPVYARVNAWTTIHLPFEATLTFGPTGATRFPIEPAGPAPGFTQLAYLGADLVFRVVRASATDVGPFAELAKGHLGRDEPLTIEIRPRDEKDKGCRLVFKDWPAQVSTEASPSTGWGVPQNAIQLSSRDGEALIVLALADAGAGRGPGSVGHAEGTYKNRLRVEALR
jgi:hypothetical protein